MKGVECVKFHIKAKAVKLAGGKVLAVHRLFAKGAEVKDGACELTEFEFPEIETYAKYLVAVKDFKVPEKKEEPKADAPPAEAPPAEGEPKPEEKPAE